ncbi:hypothetical protein CVT24_012582 [Panaeolus cyanescens]|uniref:Uncharacterized protein n=1 Tax=Panaeolus cyanescens TaxID=181874 RepID=A0A409YJZ6_9AGAR|nr:hypothetical protein CVT24_012582 [Panaeolus cyanescens]
MVPIHLRTLLSSSATSLLQELTSVCSKYGDKGYTFAFSLSTNYSKSEELETVFGQLAGFNKNNLQKGQTIGCLVEPPTGIYLPQENLQLRSSRADYISCSLAVFDSTNVIAFRSDLPSEEQPQVGRWHSFRKSAAGGSEISLNESRSSASNGPVDWEDVWARSSLQSDAMPVLPQELQKASDISHLIYFTAPHPTQLTTALSSHLPHATCLGLVAAPTHFITGRAVSLFMNGKIYDSGAVGLAFKRPTESQSRVKCETTFAGFQRLSNPMLVTQTEGNMLNAVKSMSPESSTETLNPTSLLLRAIQQANLIAPTFKESEDFALAVLSSPVAGDEKQPSIEQTYTITAGDPRNRGGALSLAGQLAPKPGSVVQFVHRPHNAPIVLPANKCTSSEQSTTKDTRITFVTVPEALPNIMDGESAGAEHFDVGWPPLSLDSTFFASSAQGFLLSRPQGNTTSSESLPSRTWTAILPGTMATLTSGSNVGS